ncbi:multidrug effflux MFS transporter [Rhizobium calliandrae]|uniref:Multidrug effflux MFS transporter n=1 Tax=Rhizobium calliandrae TaxID=1312182 RepID=A0ABT7KH97_9HYPH|nr:multidrug effflux MFS transporter [Rhizobium calliandrae]MDL2407552.1 multidrug effflux MFS transporter [Rhizobium calliandrae]
MTSDNPIHTSHTQITKKAAAASRSAPPRLTTLILLSALSVLPVNMILPSLPKIAGTFHADYALVNLTVAGYTIVTALIEVVAGTLSDRYGRRPVALIAVSIFIVASVGCAFAANIDVFLVFRAMQASIGACFSVALVVVTETSGEGGAASRIGYASMGWAIAPMVGPLFGGLLDGLFGWRAVFIVMAILGTAVLVLCVRELWETAPRASRPVANYFISYARLLSSARFWAYTLCMACSMGTLYIFLGGAPLAFAQSLGGSSATLGFYMGLVPAGFILGSYLAGRYTSRNALSTILILARIFTCTGLLVGLALSMSGTALVLAFFGPCMFIGIGNGLTMPAANTGVLSVRPDLAGTAAGLSAAMRLAGGALIGAIAGLFLARSNTTYALLIMMLASASLALFAACCVAFLDRRACEPVS